MKNSRFTESILETTRRAGFKDIIVKAYLHRIDCRRKPIKGWCVADRYFRIPDEITPNMMEILKRNGYREI